MSNDVRDLTIQEMDHVFGGRNSVVAEARSNEAQLEGSGGLGSINVGISGTLAAGAILVGTLALVPGPHTPVAAAIATVLGAGSLVAGILGV